MRPKKSSVGPQWRPAQFSYRRGCGRLNLYSDRSWEERYEPPPAPPGAAQMRACGHSSCWYRTVRYIFLYNVGTVYNFAHVRYLTQYTVITRITPEGTGHFSTFSLRKYTEKHPAWFRTSNGNGTNIQKFKWQPKNIKNRLRCRRQISLRAIMLVSVLSMMGAAAVSASS
jgi:hypothetical protein